MKMRILTMMVLTALTSRVALAADESDQLTGSAVVGSAPTGNNDYWQPSFGGQPIRYPGVSSTLTGSDVDWQPPFGGHAKRSADAASALTGSNIEWQPPFGGHATRSAGAASRLTGGNDLQPLFGR